MHQRNAACSYRCSPLRDKQKHKLAASSISFSPVARCVFLPSAVSLVLILLFLVFARKHAANERTRWRTAIAEGEIKCEREKERERERGREGKGRREARTKGARASARETEGMSVNDATRRKGYTDTTGTRKKAGDTTRRSGRDKERRA